MNNSHQNSHTESGFNRSTEKALMLLELLATSGEALRLMDISSASGLNQSTVLRYLTSLIHSGYIMQDTQTQKYQPTFKLCRLAHAFTQSRSIARITHPHLLRLTREVGESSCVSIRQGVQMVYIDVVAGQNNVLLSVQQIGSTSPMHCTGNGKLMLSGLKDEELCAFVLQTGLTRYTEHTICDIDTLRKELSAIRAQGYALDQEECELGTRCVALPLRDYTGEIVAGLSVTAPAARLERSTLAHILPILRKTAEQISTEMGYAATADPARK